MTTSREVRRARRERRERLKRETPRDDDFDDELELEKFAVRYAERRGFCGLKIELPGDNHWPDRLFFGKHQTSLAATCFFVEFKDIGEEPRSAQRVMHEFIRRKYGVPVHVADRWSEFLRIWRRETGYLG